ncbi:hypothetical protein HED60_03120 [Planctomycetales bacterium ZRK34]|nr:hypothetical protein HED60_03120 [Planctomycetales bacterium ZRK34]
MVRAYHVIFCAYGFWLPNDPRGSWSDFVGAWELVRFGRATKTDTRRSVAGQTHDHRLRQQAKAALKYPAVEFDGLQARAIARGFALKAETANYNMLACAILPEHVHLVIGRHTSHVEQIVNQLKGAATCTLINEQRHPLSQYTRHDGRTPSPWAAGLWKVYLNSSEDIRRAMRYVEQNPIKEGKRAQAWDFVMR